MTSNKPLAGRVALVAGATRGAGRAFAIELGAAGATVYATGRSTRDQRSEIDRPETIDETAQIINSAGGNAIAVACDHLNREQVAELVSRIEAEQGHLDILINGIWGGDHITGWHDKMWEHDLDKGFHMLELAIKSHIITSHYALPLVIKRPGGIVFEITDGNTQFNSEYRGTFFYDLAKVVPQRMALGLAEELAPFGVTALALSPGWIRSENMLDAYGVTEENWRDGTKQSPHFCITETPHYVARVAVALACDPQVSRWAGQSLASWDLAAEYDVYDLDGTQPNFGKYYAEVQLPDKPANDAGYR